MTDIIAQTVKALGLGRWVSSDKSQPNTVEFWVRLFAQVMTKKLREGTKLTEPQKGYVKFITKALFESESGYSNLKFIVPHIAKMQQWSPDLVPPLTTVLVKLNEIRFDKPETEESFHNLLQEDFTLTQMQTVYNSTMYVGFLKERFAAQLKNAQEDHVGRAALLPLLQESAESVEMKAKLKIVATLDDAKVQLKEKVDLLWSTPNAQCIISAWAGMKDAWAKYMPFASKAQWPPQAAGQAVQDVYAVMGDLEDAGFSEVPNVAMNVFFGECSKVRATGNVALLSVFYEQIVARSGATGESTHHESPDNMDISDCKEVAKELCKQWISAVKKGHVQISTAARVARCMRQESQAEDFGGMPAGGP